jgi:hypothetical protein
MLSVTNSDFTQFALLCLRARLQQDTLTQAREVVASAAWAWEGFSTWADHESLSPLIYSILRGKSLLPDLVEEDLRRTYYRSAGRSALITSDVNKIYTCLAQMDVKAILLKGAALIESIYHNAALRPMVDIDILVQRDDAPTVVEHLTKLGYVPASLESRTGDIYLFESEIQLRKPDGTSILLELHWNLVDSVYHQTMMNLDWFWQSALPIQSGGLDKLIPGPEGQLLHLCAHLYLHHAGSGLLWQHDIAEVLSTYREDINWDTLLRKAVEWHVVMPLQKALPGIITAWHLPIDQQVLYQISKLTVSPAERRMFEYVQKAHHSVANHFFADLAGLPDWQSRVHYARNNLLPSWSYMRQRYKVSHPLLTIFYYPLRWYLGLKSAALSHKPQQEDTATGRT